MAELVFREMDVRDIPEAVRLERQLFSCPWSEQAFLESLNQDTLFVTAQKDSVIVGYCGMYCYAGGEGEITNVAVAPRCQNQGIGRKMMEYLLAQARTRGIIRIILEARVSNANAIHLYEETGFRSCGIRKNLYELPREDGIIMVLE
ncbi:ribosomal-protein-alanine N-acetyltransferase [Petralouisia muris]|jgi:ribosomal-protein-alanine N-acetyltransferase|uniref:Ribosomal-protein-alanine N-acetyltransferase n=1 Tax=Petralouisia muris TaxID=3032872 RepID=A0AC61RXD6_9FIRM|nr:ribosomal protein S18-alanine N-acetyltransferase [Petralouisia muris]TGY96678.1 ribosomal-protein-alanine N-acetyltransferase [Petralouisia muris]